MNSTVTNLRPAFRLTPIEKFDLQLNRRHHVNRVRVAKATGDKQLSATIYDPDVFIIGTEHATEYTSKHKRNPAKALQLREDASTLIEIENNILFDKLEKQMLRTTKNQVRYSPDRTRVIHAQHKILSTASHERRRNHFSQLMDENMRFLKRLQEAKSNYRTIEWEKEHKQLESI